MAGEFKTGDKVRLVCDVNAHPVGKEWEVVGSSVIFDYEVVDADGYRYALKRDEVERA